MGKATVKKLTRSGASDSGGVGRVGLTGFPCPEFATSFRESSALSSQNPQPGSSELLDPEHHRRAVNAVERLDRPQRLLEEAEAAGVQQEDHVEERGVRLVGLDR